MIRKFATLTAALACASLTSAQTFTQVINAPPESLEPLRVRNNSYNVPLGTQANVIDSEGVLGILNFEIHGELNYFGPVQPGGFINTAGINSAEVNAGGSFNLLQGTNEILFVRQGGTSTLSGGEVTFALEVTGGDLAITGDSTIASYVTVSGGSIEQTGGDIIGGPGVFVGGPSPGVSPPGASYTFAGGGVSADGIDIQAFNGGTINFRGTTLDYSQNRFDFNDGGTANFFGSEFAIDGVPVDLEPGTPLVIDQRDVTLSGRMENGLPIELVLTSLDTSVPGEAFVSPGATITVTLTIPEPTAACLATLAAACGLRRASTRRR